MRKEIETRKDKQVWIFPKLAGSFEILKIETRFSMMNE